MDVVLVFVIIGVCMFGSGFIFGFLGGMMASRHVDRG